VPEVVDGGAVSRCLCEWAEQEVLVERARAAVDVAADEVDVQLSDVRGGQDDALQGRALEVLDVAAEPGSDPVGIHLAQFLGPRTVANVDFGSGIAFDASGRKLLQLDPDDPGALGSSRRIHGDRLAADDRRLGRQEAALCLVHRA